MNLQPYKNPTTSINLMTNLFKLYLDKETGSYYYNICNSIFFPKDLNNTAYQDWQIPGSGMSWVYISFLVYGTTDLWWMLCILNNIDNPLIIPKAGTIIKILSPAALRSVLSQIQYNKN